MTVFRAGKICTRNGHVHMWSTFSHVHRNDYSPTNAISKGSNFSLTSSLQELLFTLSGYAITFRWMKSGKEGWRGSDDWLFYVWIRFILHNAFSGDKVQYSILSFSSQPTGGTSPIPPPPAPPPPPRSPPPPCLDMRNQKQEKHKT